MIAIPLWLAALLTSAFSGLLQVLWHYLPVLGIQQLRPPATYIIGVLTALLPATGCAILAAQGAWLTMGIVWLSFLVSGLTVVLCYGLDAIRAGRVARREADALRGIVDGRED